MKTVINRGGLVSAYEGKYVTAYADGETADLVKSSQFVVKVISTADVFMCFVKTPTSVLKLLF